MFSKPVRPASKATPKEIRCCEAFEQALKMAQEALENAIKPDLQDLHYAWQREQKGLPTVSDEAVQLAEKFHLPVTTERHVRAAAEVESLWRDRLSYIGSRQEQGVQAVLEYKPDGPEFFDHGDTPFVGCQLRHADGTIEHVSVVAWDARGLIGKPVSGDVNGGFFTPSKQAPAAKFASFA